MVSLSTLRAVSNPARLVRRTGERTRTSEGFMTLLAGKNAIIYGGGGRIGTAVATAFAEEGARVFLAGRTRARLAEVAASIHAAGGSAEVAEVDALDEHAVDDHADAVAAQGGVD